MNEIIREHPLNPCHPCSIEVSIMDEKPEEGLSDKWIVG